MDANIIVDGLIFIVLIILGLIIKNYLPKYFEEKAKHLATKENFKEMLEQLKKSTELTEKIKNAFYITKATYDKYIETIMEFYCNIYRYYRSCQKAAPCTHIRFPDGTLKTTKELWEEKLDSIVTDYRNHEGYIRLLLPSSILLLGANVL